jgi:hypothetical protein
VAEVLAPAGQRRLERRAQRLVALIAAADAVLRRLNESLDAECKKFGRFTQPASRS